MVGTNIAHYKVTAKLGKGGMGEVYRATDTKLHREVAIKVLPESFSQDQERLARFTREAKTLATLNHANISGIYGLEQVGKSQALVLELIEGEDLSERLKRGPLPYDEILEIGKQIANALEAAHEKGIIHRDLKPANIKCSTNGGIKVLDFGLAKALLEEPQQENATNLQDSPTITDDFTRPGTILGTAAYMSPEQVRGKPLDERADIWAFGCILYECLTGKKAFKGEEVTEILASALKEDPDWEDLPPDLPVILTVLLKKCLSKKLHTRLRRIEDARIDLEYAESEGVNQGQKTTENASNLTAHKTTSSVIRFVFPILACCVLTAALIWKLKPVPKPSSPKVSRISIDLGTDSPLHFSGGRVIKFSPDGSTIGFIALDEDLTDTCIYVRRLDQLDAIPIPGAAPADQFCFSPDGNWIAFRDYETGWIKKVLVTGGSVMRLCQADSSHGMDWGDKDTIVFATATGGIQKVSSKGGNPETITQLSENELTHRWPQALPGGKVLYVAHMAQGSFSRANIILYQPSKGKSELVYQGGSCPIYLKNGQIVFWSGNNMIMSLPLLTQTPKGQAQPTLIQDGIKSNFGGMVSFGISNTGSLIYIKNQTNAYQLDLVDREGERETFLPAANYHSFRFSSDGKHLAYSKISQNKGVDIWICDADRNRNIQLTHGPEVDLFPIWSPKNDMLVYSIADRGKPALGWIPSDGSGSPQILFESDTFLVPQSWHRDERKLLVLRETKEGNNDLIILHISGNRQQGLKVEKTEVFLDSSAKESNGSYSPDGKWIAYTTKEPGNTQLYVQPVNGIGPTRVIPLLGSTSGGVTWTADSSQLVFANRDQDGQIDERSIFVSDIRHQGESLFIEPAQPWKKSSFEDSRGRRIFDLHPDGDHILIRSPSNEVKPGPYTRAILVQHVPELMRPE